MNSYTTIFANKNIITSNPEMRWHSNSTEVPDLMNKVTVNYINYKKISSTMTFVIYANWHSHLLSHMCYHF